MKSHADILRDEAKWLSVAQSIVVDRSDRDALLAGADALDTLAKVRDLLDRLDDYGNATYDAAAHLIREVLEEP